MESICYILLDVLSNGNFLSNVPHKEYEQEKAHIDLAKVGRPVPDIFRNFYHYVLSLNISDEVKFFKWRNEIFDLISKNISEPYGWMLSKGDDVSSMRVRL